MMKAFNMKVEAKTGKMKSDDIQHGEQKKKCHKQDTSTLR